MKDQQPERRDQKQPDEGLDPETILRLGAGETVLARYDGRGFASGIIGFLLGRAARSLVVTDRRLVLDYGLGDTSTLHYGPGAAISLCRSYPKLPVLSVLKRAAVILIALVLLTGDPIHTALGALLLVAVAHCFVTDWVFSTLELVTPDPGGVYRTRRARLLTGFRRSRLHKFVERLNEAMAEHEATGPVPDLRIHQPANTCRVAMPDEHEPNRN